MALVFISLASGAYLLLPNRATAPQTPSVAPVAQNLPWPNVATNTTISEPQDKPVAKIAPSTITATPTKNENPTSSIQIPDQNQIAVTIIINNQTYPLNLPEKSTAYAAMVQLVADKKITVVFKEFSGLGYFVDEVDGVKTDGQSGKYWIYYLNGKPAQIGISNYILKNNDLITWKYEVPQF